MKRRVRKIANFFAFNLLFFALYLNFIHKDKMVLPTDQTNQVKTAAFSGTVLVDNPEEYLQKKQASLAQQPVTAKTKESTHTPLTLSIN
jgi:hypothetical protein